jgi:hypothetical protein
MECEEFDTLVNGMCGQYEEELNSSCWSEVMEFNLEISIDHESGDSNGMPLRWELTVQWGMDGFKNPFEYKLEDENETLIEEKEEKKLTLFKCRVNSFVEADDLIRTLRGRDIHVEEEKVFNDNMILPDLKKIPCIALSFLSDSPIITLMRSSDDCFFEAVMTLEKAEDFTGYIQTYEETEDEKAEKRMHYIRHGTVLRKRKTPHDLFMAKWRVKYNESKI